MSVAYLSTIQSIKLLWIFSLYSLIVIFFTLLSSYFFHFIHFMWIFSLYVNLFTLFAYCEFFHCDFFHLLWIFSLWIFSLVFLAAFAVHYPRIFTIKDNGHGQTTDTDRGRTRTRTGMLFTYCDFFSLYYQVILFTLYFLAYLWYNYL